MAGIPPVRIAGISGSLRRASYNTALLNAAASLAPDGVFIERVDISAIPLYNDDVREESGFPAAVQQLRESVRSADGVLIATPEYNYSIPGVLKNAIDWASRAPDQPFNDKPVAIMGASPGLFGTARGQYHLRQVFVFLNAHVMTRPELMVSSVSTKFDQDGNVTDDRTRESLRAHVAAFVSWIERLRV
jgi:chromate reductase